MRQAGWFAGITVCVALVLLSPLLCWLVVSHWFAGDAPSETAHAESIAALEKRLAPLALPMLAVQRGDWLANNDEPGQTFAQYLDSHPVRRGENRSTLYICEVGSFNEEQTKILETTYEYLALFFDAPVRVRKRLALSEIPTRAQRRHPQWGVHQLEVGHLLDRVLKPDRPADALAYTAFTAHDLWPATTPPERPYNFVFGQASLGERVGAWSMNRFGDPAQGETARLLCLRRTLGTATHETGHILSLQHCTAFQCNMCGANSNEEGDRHPLYFCPVCLRKLCWNLNVEPVAYLKRLETFCLKHRLVPEAEYYRRAVRALTKD